MLCRAVIVVSASARSSGVRERLRDVAVPLVVLEPNLFDDFGFTGSKPGTDFGEVQGVTAIDITSSGATHPLGAGLLAGATPVVTQATPLGYGKPRGTFVNVATMASTRGRST